MKHSLLMINIMLDLSDIAANVFPFLSYCSRSRSLTGQLTYAQHTNCLCVTATSVTATTSCASSPAHLLLLLLLHLSLPLSQLDLTADLHSTLVSLPYA